MTHKLKTYLKERRIPYRDFAEEVGLSAASVSDIVNGHQMPSLLVAWNIELATNRKVKMQDLVSK
jgi:transcriptional regulator with XRE-family HTH domain